MPCATHNRHPPTPRQTLAGAIMVNPGAKFAAAYSAYARALPASDILHVAAQDESTDMSRTRTRGEFVSRHGVPRKAYSRLESLVARGKRVYG